MVGASRFSSTIRSVFSGGLLVGAPYPTFELETTCFDHLYADYAAAEAAFLLVS